MVKISYANRNVEKYFKDYNLMRRKIGDNLTRAVKKRIDQLKAAKNVAMYISTRIGNPHPLHGDLNGCIGISITGNYRLIVQPVESSMDVQELRVCQLVEVKGVDDYHDGKSEWLIS